MNKKFALPALGLISALLLATAAYAQTQGNGDWIYDVPEPGTLALLGAGVIGLIVRRRRQG